MRTVFFAGLEDVKTSRLSRKSYRSLRLPPERRVIYVENVGNCCFSIYGRKHFRGGAKLHLRIGVTEVPNFVIKSLKKVECK